MRESILKIGKPIPLVGVYTDPETGLEANTAMLLLNSGIMHRAGACRMSVKLARSVALENGLPCFRFDFSGIGDSEIRSDQGFDFDRASVAQVTEVMDYLQKVRGIDRFVLYGLCSGALISCTTAVADDRVIAVAQVDGCCYPTFKSYVLYYISRLQSWRGWRTRVARWFGIAGKGEEEKVPLTGGITDFEVPDFSDDPGHQATSSQLNALMSKKIKLYCVFTGSEPYYRYHDQYKDCFANVDFGSNLSLDYFPTGSHIFVEPTYQRQLVTGINRWIATLLS